MYLPPEALYCIQKLEQAGYEAYAVGGCVRDSLLGLTPHDYDLCTAATPDVTASIFSGHNLVRSGEKHGTIGVVLAHNVYEITTFRTEGGYADSRHPDWVRFVPKVEDDLARRDFTVNAMAYSPSRGYIDPFGGQLDLENKVLRSVGDPEIRFAEDALRILRGVRFAARYGFTVDAATQSAMFHLSPLMDQLARERIFEELCKLLPLVTAEDLLRFSPVLTQVLPELAPMVEFQQHSPYHSYDVYTHTAHVVESVPPDLPLRWAALLHDAGKPDCLTLDQLGCGHFLGHAARSAEMADAILLRLKAPTALRDRVTTLIRQHMTQIPPEYRSVRRTMSRLGSETLQQLLLLQEADMHGKGTGEPDGTAQFRDLHQLVDRITAENACLTIRDLAVSGYDLMALGLQGPAIGKALQGLLELVLDEQIPNDKTALLQALQQCNTNQESFHGGNSL